MRGTRRSTSRKATRSTCRPKSAFASGVDPRSMAGRSVRPAVAGRRRRLFLQDQVAINADAVDDQQRDILPSDAFAVGLEEAPCDQRDAAGDEEDRKSTRLNPSP